jgi:hypothetical protein
MFVILQNAVSPAVRLLTGVQWSGGSGSGHLVGSVEAGGFGGNSEGTIKVSETKMLFKSGHGFVDFVFETIFTTSEVKQASVVNDVVTHSGKGMVINDFFTSCRKFFTIVELFDEVLEGSRGVPGCFHAFFVGTQVAGTDFSKACPKVGNDVDGRNFVETASWVTEGLNVAEGNGRNELVANSLGGVVVLFVRKFFIGVATVRFGDLRSGGSIWMVNIDRRFFGWHTRDAVGEFKMSTGKLVLSTALRTCAHALSCDTQGKLAKTNHVCLVTDCNNDCFGLVTGQLNVQIHHVTVLGLDRYHAWKHGYYGKLAHGSVHNTVGLMKMVHGNA